MESLRNPYESVKSPGQKTDLIQCLFQLLGTILLYTGCPLNLKTTQITLQLILFKPFVVSSLVKEQTWHGSPFHSQAKIFKNAWIQKNLLYHNMDVYLMFSFHILSLEHQTYQS